MAPGLNWLLFSTLSFGGAMAWTAASLRSGRPHRFPWDLLLMAAGFAGQCLFLSHRGQQAGRCPITSPSEILVFVAWSAVLLYFVVGRPFRLSLLGLFTAPLAALFQMAAWPGLREAPVHRPSSDYWLEMHASVSLLAYGAFALASIAGVMFLVQDHLLRRGHLAGLSSNLPPVTNLTQSIVRLLFTGLCLLSLGILSGFGMQKPPSGFHLTLSLFVWLLYASLWSWRRWGRLPNSRMAWCAIASFLLPVATLGFMQH